MTDICQYCGSELQTNGCINPACPGGLIVHKFSLPDGKLVDITDERIWFYGPFDYLTTDEIDVIHAEIHRNDPDIAEVEDLLDHIISAANSVSIPSESNYLNELKSRLLAALSNTAPYLSGDVKGWLPIETAPKDGTRVKLLTQGGKEDIGYWSNYPRCNPEDLPGEWSTDFGNCDTPITHWMPLPEPPRREGE